MRIDFTRSGKPTDNMLSRPPTDHCATSALTCTGSSRSSTPKRSSRPSAMTTMGVDLTWLSRTSLPPSLPDRCCKEKARASNGRRLVSKTDRKTGALQKRHYLRFIVVRNSRVRSAGRIRSRHDALAQRVYATRSQPTVNSTRGIRRTACWRVRAVPLSARAFAPLQGRSSGNFATPMINFLNSLFPQEKREGPRSHVDDQ